MGEKLWLQQKQIRISKMIFDSYVGKTESLWITLYKQFPGFNQSLIITFNEMFSILLKNILTELRKKVLYQGLFVSCYKVSGCIWYYGT